MSRDYWKFYREDLHYPEIQKPGPLALLAQAEAGELADLFQSGLRIRDQFFPSKAEDEGVALHGQARGVPRLDLENSYRYRLRVAKAFAWQRLAGRHWGLYKIFADYGLPIVKLEYLKGERWAEFDLEVEAKPGVEISEDTWELMTRLIFEYKRAIAMPRRTQILKRFKGEAKLAMGLVVGEQFTVYPPEPDLTMPLTKVCLAAAGLTHEKWTVLPPS